MKSPMTPRTQAFNNLGGEEAGHGGYYSNVPTGGNAWYGPPQTHEGTITVSPVMEQDEYYSSHEGKGKAPGWGVILLRNKMSENAVNHIVCVGAVYIDTILTYVLAPCGLAENKAPTNRQTSSVPHFPIEDEKLRAKSITRRRGGNTANSLEVLLQLQQHDPETARKPQSTDLHLLAVLPDEDSAASKFICESLPQVKISDVSLFRKQHQEAASSYIIQSEENRSRTIISINQLPEMQGGEFIQQVCNFTGGSGGKEQGWEKAWFHFEGRVPEITLLCVRFLREQFPHFNISVECEKPERTGMAEVAQYADAVFYSKLWAEKNGYTDAKSFLEDRRSETRDGAILCCTWGSGGA
uniref:Ketohexokinase n=1 Tax=Solanum lycopersicum TaxID=4081 RepID=A0A494G9A8_SOLLC